MCCVRAHRRAWAHRLPPESNGGDPQLAASIPRCLQEIRVADLLLQPRHACLWVDHLLRDRRHRLRHRLSGNQSVSVTGNISWHHATSTSPYLSLFPLRGWLTCCLPGIIISVFPWWRGVTHRSAAAKAPPWASSQVMPHRCKDAAREAGPGSSKHT